MCISHNPTPPRGGRSVNFQLSLAYPRVHNIANSVVVLDEAQYLPPHLLDPILDVLNRLVRNYGLTLVLCTATQSAFETSPHLCGLDRVEEIMPDPGRLFLEIERVKYEVFLDEEWSWGRVAEEMKTSPQALTVLNTRADALSLLDALEDPDALHLSTLLCGAHRRDVIKEVKRRLNADEPCRLVSTQVVEAGVDLDFPLVMRALGPLDRIVQAAGRCNREGSLKREGRIVKGRVVVFRPSEGGAPKGVYQSGVNETEFLLGGEPVDFNDPSTYPAYFHRLYQLVTTDREGIQELRGNFDFPEVDERFRLIDQTGVPVVVGYQGPEGKDRGPEKILDKFRYGKGGTPRRLWRGLQLYLVNLSQHVFAEAQGKARVEEVIPGVHVWRGRYDPVRGLGEGVLDPQDLYFA